jgi:ferredoxin-type protein NapG
MGAMDIAKPAAAAKSAAAAFQSDAQVNRRAFVGLAGKALGVVALGGAVRLLPHKERYFRPPGALTEDEFLSVCIRCDVCMTTCPHHLITPVPITDLICAGTPEIKQFSCPNCRRCIPVCPVGALVRWRM